MSRQLLCAIFVLQLHACFASRSVGFFHYNLLNLHKEELLGSKETTMEGTTNVAFEVDVENVETTAVSDSKLAKQKEKRMVQDMKMVEGRRAILESSTPNVYDEANESENRDGTGEDIEVKDYAQPQRKPPIHNQRP